MWTKLGQIIQLKLTIQEILGFFLIFGTKINPNQVF